MKWELLCLGKLKEGWTDFVGDGVVRNDVYGDHFYTPLFEDPDKYMYNKLLGIGDHL